jgi:hypothetical protein
MTPRDGDPPFIVAIYDGASLLSRSTFDTHDEAIAFAVEGLTIASKPAD